MSDDSSDSIDKDFDPEPTLGDGVVTFPSLGETEMAAVDLPESVASQLLTETVGNIQATNNNGRNIANISMGSLQAGVAMTHNELGPVESRAVSGVLATPVASPSTGA